MTWNRSFNQAYPGALQYLQAGAYLPNPAGAYTEPRGRNPAPDWCPSSIVTTIEGKKWCFDHKTNGWICAEASGNCDPEGASEPMGLTARPPARLRRGRLRNPVQQLGCAPKELKSAPFEKSFPDAYASGCRLFSACGCPPGWKQADQTLCPLPLPGDEEKPCPVICCPPECIVCLDDDACKHPEIQCLPEWGGVHPAPTGFHHTGLWPETIPKGFPGWEDTVGICCPNARPSPAGVAMKPSRPQPQPQGGRLQRARTRSEPCPPEGFICMVGVCFPCQPTAVRNGGRLQRRARARNGGCASSRAPNQGVHRSPLYSYTPSSLFHPDRVGISDEEARQWTQVYPGQRRERVIAEQQKVGMSAAEAQQWRQVYPGQQRERELGEMGKVGIPAAEVDDWRVVHAAQLPERGFVANPHQPRTRIRSRIRTMLTRLMGSRAAPKMTPARARRTQWVSLPGRPRGWCGPGEHLCEAKSPGPGSNYCCCNSEGECVGGKIVLANMGAPRRVQNGCFRPGHANHPGRAVVACRMQNPGPNGEAIAVTPFCATGDCTSKSCGSCDWNDYAVPGRVQTVLDAVAQSREDVDFAMSAANQGLRDMYMPPYQTPWADPSKAILTKPGGPTPQNPMGTAQWQRCLRGPAVTAYPSQSTQYIPGGTP